jgi:hypothetical protein
MQIQITEIQLKTLFKVKEEDRGKGGFQNLILKLQSACDRERFIVNVNESEIYLIRRYVKNYKTGGWQSYLKSTFASVLS